MLYVSFVSFPHDDGRTAASSVTDEEIRLAEEKFAESLHLAQMGMHNILDNDVSWLPLVHTHDAAWQTSDPIVVCLQVEQISQLASFAESLLEYHKQCTDILKVLTETLHDKLVTRLVALAFFCYFSRTAHGKLKAAE